MRKGLSHRKSYHTNLGIIASQNSIYIPGEFIPTSLKELFLKEFEAQSDGFVMNISNVWQDDSIEVDINVDISAKQKIIGIEFY